MIKVLLKLVLAALIANATWRIGSAYLSFYRFKDAVQQTMQYGPERSEAQLQSKILELASQHDVPLTTTGFTVRRDENHTIVDGGYHTAIDLLPGYQYDWPFTVHIDTFSFRP